MEKRAKENLSFQSFLQQILHNEVTRILRNENEAPVEMKYEEYTVFPTQYLRKLLEPCTLSISHVATYFALPTRMQINNPVSSHAQKVTRKPYQSTFQPLRTISSITRHHLQLIPNQWHTPSVSVCILYFLSNANDDACA